MASACILEEEDLRWKVTLIPVSVEINEEAILGSKSVNMLGMNVVTTTKDKFA